LAKVLDEKGIKMGIYYNWRSFALLL